MSSGFRMGSVLHMNFVLLDNNMLFQIVAFMASMSAFIWVIPTDSHIPWDFGEDRREEGQRESDL